MNIISILAILSLLLQQSVGLFSGRDLKDTLSNVVNSQPVGNDIVTLTEDNFVVIRGPINGQSASRVIAKMMETNQTNLYVYINSNGGSVTSGMQIVQTLKAIEKSGVNVTCIGNVALSMGFVIMQYCQNRFVLESSVLMQHQMSLGVEGQLFNIKSYLEFIDSMKNNIVNHQAARIGMKSVQFEDLTRHDWWLFGADIVNKKAADKLVYVLCDFKHSTEVETFQSFFGNVYVHFPKCPVAKDPVRVEFDFEVNTNNTKAVQEILQNIKVTYDIDAYVRDRMLKGDNGNTYML